MFSRAGKIKKAFIICNREDYDFIKKNYEELFGDLKDIRLLFPLDFNEIHLGEKIIKNASNYVKIVLEEMAKDIFFSDLDHDEKMVVAKNSSVKLSEKKWLRAKLEDSKKKINQADECILLVNEDNHYDYQTYDEVTTEIEYAGKKEKEVNEIESSYCLTSSPLVYSIGQKRQG